MARCSILLTHSRVTPRRVPTFLSVRGCLAVESEAEGDDGFFAAIEAIQATREVFAFLVGFEPGFGGVLGVADFIGGPSPLVCGLVAEAAGSLGMLDQAVADCR